MACLSTLTVCKISCYTGACDLLVIKLSSCIYYQMIKQFKFDMSEAVASSLYIIMSYELPGNVCISLLNNCSIMATASMVFCLKSEYQFSMHLWSTSQTFDHVKCLP